MSLCGITLVRNGNTLGYPWKECILSMAEYCDEVLINVGDSSDNTDQEIAYLERPYIHAIPTEWNMQNTGNGSELAEQVNNILSWVHNDWILYLQADEFLLKEDGCKLRVLLEMLPETITQIELFRTYFYGDINTRLPKEELYLGRVFRKGTHTIGGDGMYLNRLSGEVLRTDILIYHYSRIGTEEEIDRRVKNLDRLFHPEEEVVLFPTFKYDRSLTVPYNGPQPKGIIDFYDRRSKI